EAYGFAGAPNLHAITGKPLAAPQANLISALAQGVIGGKLDWSLIRTGALIGVGIVALDELCRARGWLRLPPLAVGLGIYLPMSATLPVCVGAVLGWLYDRRARSEHTKRLGVLVASGMIVGESLFGVVNAGLVKAFETEGPLSVVGHGYTIGYQVGLVLFVLSVALLYLWLFRKNHRP
ncbi:MAG: OPT/YSL family transporter, partial [Alphaproteobacteria bacterium]|nr:OPT/YSL family transporter [Alphaproteobacteria bacterium]